MPIQAILFDADGVIIHPNRFARYLERELALSRTATSEFFDGAFLKCLIGQADLREEIAPFLPSWGWNASVDEFLSRWFDEENAIDPRMIDVVRKLRQRQLVCALATNQEKYRLGYMRSKMGLEMAFDAIFCSCELGALKHEVRYYRQVTEKLGLPKQAILFWDDSVRNIGLAHAYGWHAETYTTFEMFQERMQVYLSDT